jgi:hypothetical protein
LVLPIEPYAALALAGLYWLSVALWFPAFLTDVAPLLRDVYAPARRDFTVLLTAAPFLAWLTLAAVLTVTARRRLIEPLIATPALASIGAIAVFFLQGKGWPYHAYPALALAIIAFGPLIFKASTTDQAPTLPLSPPRAAALGLALVYVCNAPHGDSAPLERLVARLAPHPKILTISPDISLGHPLTRHVAGVWVGSFPCLWVTDAIYFLEERKKPDEATRARYARYLERDRETLVRDIVKNKPDAILVADDNWKTWAFAHPDVAAALWDYAPADVVGGVAVYTPRPGLRGPIEENGPQ